jgi:hypothetical protein
MAFFPRYSADTVRLAMANSGDTLEPANFDQSVCHWARYRAMGFTVPMENGGFTHGKWWFYPWKMVIEPSIFGKNRDLYGDFLVVF